MKGNRIDLEEGEKSEYRDYNVNGVINRKDTNYHSFSIKNRSISNNTK